MCSVEVKVMLFRSYCTPLYTAHLWTNYSKSTIKDFYIAYHNIMKLFIGFRKYDHNRPLCVKYNIPHGPALVRNLIYRFMCRLQESHNSLLCVLNDSDCQYESPLRKKWISLLYIQSTNKIYVYIFSICTLYIQQGIPLLPKWGFILAVTII